MSIDNAQASLPTQYVDAFEANLSLLPQQKQSALISRVDSNLAFNINGDRFNGDDMDTSEPKEIEDRFGPSPEGAVAQHRRVGFLVPYDDGKFVDDVDKAMSLSDPTNPTMQAMMAGHNRFRDAAIVTAALGSAREGRTGENTVVFPAGNIVARDSWAYYDLNLPNAPAGNAGLTVSKLIEAKVKIEQAYGDQDLGPLTIVVDPADIGQLLRDRQLTSSDFNTVKALVAGEINTFMGWEFVRYNKLPVAAGVRTVVAFAKNAIMYRAKTLQDVKITQRADRRFNWYAYYKGMHGTLRRYDEAVMQILCTA